MSTSKHRFFQILLRTLDEPAARDFYARVLGVPREDVCVVPLHESAVARGARPHWIGFLETSDVSAAAAEFTRRGATALGPKWVNPQGLEAAVMRDPGGAMVALAKPPPGYRAPTHEVAWSVLNTADVEAAKRNYAELFGWAFGAPGHIAGQGAFVPFSWQPDEPHVGSIGDISGRPGVHPHWLFFLRVAALGPALQAVRDGGGRITDERTLPTGERFAVCDDPQGAAFGVWQS